MNLGELKEQARFLVPGAKTSEVSDSVLVGLINQGALDINSQIGYLTKNKKFDIEADKSIYSITSDIANDYLNIDTSGVWWYDGNQWKQMEALTRAHLDDEYVTWRNDSSGDPLRFFINGDSLVLNPPPDTTLSEGGWMYYIRKAVEMSDDTHYPFPIETSQTTPTAGSEILDDAIIKFVEIKLEKGLSKDDINRRTLLIQDYRSELGLKADILNRRPDISQNRREARYAGRRWGN